MRSAGCPWRHSGCSRTLHGCGRGVPLPRVVARIGDFYGVCQSHRTHEHANVRAAHEIGPGTGSPQHACYHGHVGALSCAIEKEAEHSSKDGGHLGTSLSVSAERERSTGAACWSHEFHHGVLSRETSPTPLWAEVASARITENTGCRQLGYRRRPRRLSTERRGGAQHAEQLAEMRFHTRLGRVGLW